MKIFWLPTITNRILVPNIIALALIFFQIFGKIHNTVKCSQVLSRVLSKISPFNTPVVFSSVFKSVLKNAFESAVKSGDQDCNLQKRLPYVIQALFDFSHMGDSPDEVIKLVNEIKLMDKPDSKSQTSNRTPLRISTGDLNNQGQTIPVEETSMDVERIPNNFTLLLKYTKRWLVKLLMSLYDPLGLLSHYLILLRILRQDVWMSNIGWNETQPSHLKGNWLSWLELLLRIEKLNIPRWYLKQLNRSRNSWSSLWLVGPEFLKYEEVAGATEENHSK